MTNHRRLLLPVMGITAHLTALLPAVTAGQELQVSDRVSCETCRVAVNPVVRLGSADDPAGFSPIVSVARTMNHYLVSASTFVGEVFVYDLEGQFVRAVGRHGGGPGEFTSAVLLRPGQGDTAHAIETRGGRYHVMTARGITRTSVLQSRVFAYDVDDAQRIWASSPITKDRQAYAVQIFSKGGKLEALIDEVSSAGPAARRVLAMSSGGAVWSAAVDRYELRLYNAATGRSVLRLVGERDWWPTSSATRQSDIRRAPPRPQVVGVSPITADTLAVYIAVADKNWERGVAERASRLLYDTRIEFVTRQGHLIATTIQDEVIFPMSDNLAYAVVESEDGDLHIQILNVELRLR